MKDSNFPLPVKNGVSPNCLWLPEGNWTTVLNFFIESFPHINENDWIERFQRKEVVSESGKIFDSNSSYDANQHIYFYRELEDEIKVPFEEEIIFQDDNILVVDKPHFLPVAPTGQYLHETLLVRLRQKLNLDTLELSHRLDRETAGIVLLTKKENVRKYYHALFSERKITKVYHALAATTDHGLPLVRKSRLVNGEPYFRMKEEEGEPNSETRIRLLDQQSNYSLYELSPITGKKHQLRVHMAAMGVPILNDSVYPDLIRKLPEDFSSPLQLLAKSFRFIDPLSGNEKYFESQRSLKNA